ncbi:MAG: hypothetical protein U0792_00405 [Gemmataceae bacterium]
MELEAGKLYDPASTDWLEFYIVLVRENADGRVPALTPRLFALKEGDRIQIGEKVAVTTRSTPVRLATRWCFWAQERARHPTITCSGVCSTTDTQAKFFPLAVFGMGVTLATRQFIIG